VSLGLALKVSQVTVKDQNVMGVQTMPTLNNKGKRIASLKVKDFLHTLREISKLA
jgi:hypothetical protein